MKPSIVYDSPSFVRTQTPLATPGPNIQIYTQQLDELPVTNRVRRTRLLLSDKLIGKLGYRVSGWRKYFT